MSDYLDNASTRLRCGTAVLVWGHSTGALTIATVVKVVEYGFTRLARQRLELPKLKGAKGTRTPDPHTARTRRLFWAVPQCLHSGDLCS